jgi:hypothetical protein
MILTGIGSSSGVRSCQLLLEHVTMTGQVLAGLAEIRNDQSQGNSTQKG